MIKVGEYAKVIDLNDVFRVIGYAHGNEFTPNGWLVGEDGIARNPDRCEIYGGATSVLAALTQKTVQYD